MRPQPRMQNKSEHTSVVTTVTPKNARHSPRNGFNAYIVLSPVTGLSCHRRCAENSRELDASVGASGPHGFAVRRCVIRPRAFARLTLPRPLHPTPNVRDDRDTPLWRGGTVAP